MPEDLITLGRAAAILDDNFDVPVSRGKVEMWVRTRLLTGFGDRVKEAEVRDLAHRSRGIGWQDFPAAMVHRVSVAAPCASVVRDQNGRVLRRRSGHDFAATTVPAVDVRGFEGVWPVAGDKLEEAVRFGGLLCATVKGYVGQGMLRRIVDHERTADGLVWFHTVADEELESFVGTGLMVPVTPGAKNRWEKDAAREAAPRSKTSTPHRA